MSLLSLGLAVLLVSSCSLTRASDFRIVCKRRPHRITRERCYAIGSSKINKNMLVQGDILVDEVENGPAVSFRNAMIDPEKLWPNATVQYIFHESYTEANKVAIRSNLHWLEERTCVRFSPWNGRGDYAVITNEEGCHSTMGHDMGSRGYARVNLHNTSCLTRPGTIQHEFLHLLGLKHEQARPDRDYYVQINWNNIREGHKKNFDRADPQRFTTFGLPYDYQSVMHYSNAEFSKNGQPTIVAKIDHKMILGQRLQATEIDLKKIRLMYHC